MYQQKRPGWGGVGGLSIAASSVGEDKILRNIIQEQVTRKVNT